MEDLIEQTKRKIESAFSTVKYPKGREVVSDADGPRLVRNFVNKQWRDIPVEVLTYSSLYFFTPEGFQFFLPAFLLAGLDEENADLRQSLVMSLAPGEDATERENFQRRIGLCTKEQRAAIRQFLQTVADIYSDNFTRRPAALNPNGFWLGGLAD